MRRHHRHYVPAEPVRGPRTAVRRRHDRPSGCSCAYDQDRFMTGVPDDAARPSATLGFGDRVGAATVLREAMTVEELREFCRGRIANFKIPELLVIVEEIPYNDFGKVDRRNLPAPNASAAAASQGGMPLVRAALLKGTKLELRQPSPRRGRASLRRAEYGAFNEIPGR